MKNRLVPVVSRANETWKCSSLSRIDSHRSITPSKRDHAKRETSHQAFQYANDQGNSLTDSKYVNIETERITGVNDLNKRTSNSMSWIVFVMGNLNIKAEYLKNIWKISSCPDRNHGNPHYLLGYFASLEPNENSLRKWS